MRSSFHHPASIARRTDSPSFARKSNQNIARNSASIEVVTRIVATALSDLLICKNTYH
jgi:hypothetical protein